MDHVIEHAHEPGLGHGHSHDHAHDHGAGEYYIQQLLSVFICGAFGVIAVLMYQSDKLRHILAQDFRFPVFLGGIALLVLAVVRGVAIWKEAGVVAHGHQHHDHAHDHHHDHDNCSHVKGEDCAHDHEHAHPPAPVAAVADHSHDDHEHGAIYWRIILLAFPVMLFCMGLPNKGLSNSWKLAYIGQVDSVGDVSEVAARGGEPLYDFQSLTLAAHLTERRIALEGTPAKIKGQFVPVPNRSKEGRLTLLKKTCCEGDTVPMEARIVASRPSIIDGLNLQPWDWVEVTGNIQFHYAAAQQKWIPLVVVRDDGGIVRCAPVD